jgi:hypothetical protein
LRKYHLHYIFALIMLCLAAAIQYCILSVWVGEERGSAVIWLFIGISLIVPSIAAGFHINFAVLGAWMEDSANQRKEAKSTPHQEAAPSAISVHNHIPFEPSQPGWTDWVIVGLLVMITLGVYRKKR